MPIFNLYPIENLNEKSLPIVIKTDDSIPSVKLVKIVDYIVLGFLQLHKTEDKYQRH